MTQFEYIAVPAPRKSKAPRKVKGPEAKFAATVTDVMNEMASDGWEYQRAETLPCEERQGFTGKTVKYHSVLIFRRLRETETVEAPAPVVAPIVEEPVFEAPTEPDPDMREEPALTRPHSDGPAQEGFMSDADTKSDTDADSR